MGTTQSQSWDSSSSRSRNSGHDPNGGGWNFDERHISGSNLDLLPPDVSCDECFSICGAGTKTDKRKEQQKARDDETARAEEARLIMEDADLFIPFPILIPGGMQICIRLPSSDTSAGWLLSELTREIAPDSAFLVDEDRVSFKGLCVRKPHPKAGLLLDLNCAIIEQVEMGTFLEAILDLPRGDLRFSTHHDAHSSFSIILIPSFSLAPTSGSRQCLVL